MNAEEFAQYKSENRQPVIRTGDLHGEARQLLHGYDLDRRGRKVRFDPARGIEVARGIPNDDWKAEPRWETEWRQEWTVDDLFPSKRAYPAGTDLEFARLMRDRGKPLAFTTDAVNPPSN